MGIVADPELEKLRAVFLRLERLVGRARDELAAAEIVLLYAKAAFCRYPPLEPPEPLEVDHAD